MTEATEDKDMSRKRIAEAAARALKEAEARRAEPRPELPTELGGRDGLEPTRYGDWESKGILSDF